MAIVPHIVVQGTELEDPFRHRWNVSQRLRDVPQEEIAAAAARMFG